jgi:hypothetical protein
VRNKQLQLLEVIAVFAAIWVLWLDADETRTGRVRNREEAEMTRRVDEFVDYARRHGSSIAEAISDRDWPATELQCRVWFQQAQGRPPTEEEMRLMSPDHIERAEEQP